MDWLASEQGAKLAHGLEMARLKLLRAKNASEALDAIIEAGGIEEGSMDLKQVSRHSHKHNLRRVFHFEWLKVFCDQMYHSLPRELRDMVYAQILDCFDFAADLKGFPNEAVKMRDEAKSILYGMGPSHKILVYKTEVRFDPLTHLGEGVVREIAELAYRHKNLTSFPLTKTDNILLPDSWRLGMKPADHIRFANLQIFEKHFEDVKFHKTLAAFAHLKPGASINVDILPEAQTGRGHCCLVATNWARDFLHLFTHKEEEMINYVRKLGPNLAILDDIKKAGARLTIRIGATRFPGLRWKNKFILLFKHQSDGYLSMKTWIERVLKAQKELVKKKYVCQCEGPADDDFWADEEESDDEDDDAEDSDEGGFSEGDSEEEDEEMEEDPELDKKCGFGGDDGGVNSVFDFEK